MIKKVNRKLVNRVNNKNIKKKEKIQKMSNN